MYTTHSAATPAPAATPVPARLPIIIAAWCCLMVLPTVAGVPQLINYQGRIAVDGVNFDGPTGQFKFALVDDGASTTYWSNDGTSVAGSPPAAAVSLGVSKGLYSVLLGDATMPNMAVMPASVFENEEVYLRVWFNDGEHDWQQLEPDQRIAAVGYAMMAGNVPDGAITSAKIAGGAVGSAHLAPGAAAANLDADGQSGVASGGIVLSDTEDNSALKAAGYVKIGSTSAMVLIESNTWLERSSPDPVPGARYQHTAVWTGTEMIVWGGWSGALYFNDGGRYYPATDSWEAVDDSGPNVPNTRRFHTAVWTGTKMIVWGGYDGGSDLNDGGRYDPVADSWEAVDVDDPDLPSARYDHTAVWTGTEMIVWGGIGNGYYMNHGSRYDPAADDWEAVNDSDPDLPSARRYSTAVWTGTEMIVWGGHDGSSTLNDGGRYDPLADSWATLDVHDPDVPGARYNHTAVWTGTEMIVWGGSGSLNDGGRYDPVANSWTAVDFSDPDVPSSRSSHTAVWTGSQMIVWGGSAGSYLNDGGRYDPLTDDWASVTTTGAPDARYEHTAVWTGSEMIIWGGKDVAGPRRDTFSYLPSVPAERTVYLYQRP